MKCSSWRQGFAGVALFVFLALGAAVPCCANSTDDNRPNILFILTDDHRSDCLSAAGNPLARTPNLDGIAQRGTRFANAFVTLAICSPSRAACLTGMYGSTNGVTSIGAVQLNSPANTFANALRKAGYATGVTGKWHLKTSPSEAGFEFSSVCWSNGSWYDRAFEIQGRKKVMPGFVDDVTASESIRFINQSVTAGQPFVLWMNTQVPHMDHRHRWPASTEFLGKYDPQQMPLPASWNDDLAGKPDYLKTARNRTRAQSYGYDDPAKIRQHARDYYASVEQMDQAVGRVLGELERLKIRDNTWVIFMGDNGWFLGEHGMTSKVLPYEESMRVPLVIAGPKTRAQVCEQIALNIDLTATILDLAQLPIPKSMHGQSLLPLVDGHAPADWRASFLYEAPTPQLGSQPLWALRDARWKYVRTELPDNSVFEELYDLSSDGSEIRNQADQAALQPVLARLRRDLERYRQHLANTASASAGAGDQEPTANLPFPAKPPEDPRTDLLISGVYPHLTTYGVYSQNGAHYQSGHNECGISAIVPWAGKLWMVNYAPHRPQGSEHKLYSVDSDLTQPLNIHPESVGGTPAGRMIHEESNQLLIGHHLIDAQGKVRTIPPSEMRIRVTAIARHLHDPENLVYYIDMEGSIWEANVRTLAVKRLFKKPVPGWHGKGGYTSQGRLVVSNNGELHVGSYEDVLVGGKAKDDEERGVLAQWDGERWDIIERRQFTEVTGPQGIAGGSDGDDPLWSVGWDRRSIRLKLLEDGQWHTYLLPKSAYCNDASHGWYTEWPRIREITDGRWMLDMHGMFFDFPKTFSVKNSQGLVPIGSHLRYVPDFCHWNGKLVLATDETSIQGNHLAGQPQSNLWFGNYEDLKTWGPANGYGGPWVDDPVPANTWSDPFLINGFEQRTLHLAVGRIKPIRPTMLRTTDQQPITSIPDRLANLPRVTVERGDWHQEAPGYSFEVNQPVTVYLAVDRRGQPKLEENWIPTSMELEWGKRHRDQVYRCDFPAGTIEISANPTEHTAGSFGMPHAVFVSSSAAGLTISPGPGVTATWPKEPDDDRVAAPVTFTVQIDTEGINEWTDFRSFTVASGKPSSTVLPPDLKGVWMRFRADRDCVATAILHQTSPYPSATLEADPDLFAGLASVDDEQVLTGRIYAAKRNRNLRMVSSDQHYYEFQKHNFAFKADTPDRELEERLSVVPEFRVDESSVVIESQGSRYRLPKGDPAFDRPFDWGWPRAVREVESERLLANIHGTFYELPLITNGAPPAWNLMRPVSSHEKQISDFCSWNGLLVMSGVRRDAEESTHLFRDAELSTGLWFGGIDDLWKLGKPIGTGGPWKNTAVRVGIPSDAYLMRGYDQKSCKLSHQSNVPVSITLEVDIDGEGRWLPYRKFDVKPDETVAHEFPKGFSASWIRAVSDTDTIATLQFEYR